MFRYVWVSAIHFVFGRTSLQRLSVERLTGIYYLEKAINLVRLPTFPNSSIFQMVLNISLICLSLMYFVAIFPNLSSGSASVRGLSPNLCGISKRFSNLRPSVVVISELPARPFSGILWLGSTVIFSIKSSTIGSVNFSGSKDCGPRHAP